MGEGGGFRKRKAPWSTRVGKKRLARSRKKRAKRGQVKVNVDKAVGNKWVVVRNDEY